MLSSARAPSRRLVAWFLLIAGIPLAALAALGWRVLQQEQVRARERARAQLQNAADLLVNEIGLDGWEALLVSASNSAEIPAPPHTTLIEFTSDGLVRRRGVALPYYPRVARPAPLAALFADAERLEYRLHDLTGAAASYRTIAHDQAYGADVRAAALVRLARVLRSEQRLRAALDAYAELEGLGDTPAGDSAAALVASHERINLLRALGQEAAAIQESTRLATLLRSRRFAVDRATYALYQEAAANSPSETENAGDIALADALDDFWPAALAQPSGRAVSVRNGKTSVAVWRTTTLGTTMLAADADTLLQPFAAVAATLGVNASLEDEQGRSVWRTASFPRAHELSLREARLPWTLGLAIDQAAANQAAAFRRNVFIAAFALMALAIATAAYFVFRSVQRELGVARLQSDFVSAVSHEFRTPLTAMRHLTEVLDDGEAPPERLPHYYRSLRKETARLHTMVEGLLDFGRLESSRRPVDLVDLELGVLVAHVVGEFRERIAASGANVELVAACEPLPIQADPHAIELALRNLLDNAVKYSPNTEPITVTVGARRRHAYVSVEDRGAGIPSSEQRAIFRKFVRGSAARALNVKGTGIGLAMAARIAAAHRGRVEVWSEVGVGSRFTIVLPLARHTSATESALNANATGSIENPTTTTSSPAPGRW